MRVPSWQVRSQASLASRISLFPAVLSIKGPTAADLRRLARTETLASSWNGAPPSDWRRQARASALEEAAAWDDPWASGEYRRDLTATLAVRALASCLGQPEIV